MGEFNWFVLECQGILVLFGGSRLKERGPAAQGLSDRYPLLGIRTFSGNQFFDHGSHLYAQALLFLKRSLAFQVGLDDLIVVGQEA